MEKIEQTMFYKQAKKLTQDESVAFSMGIPSEILIHELLRRLALCESVLDKMDPGLKEKLYKP